MHASELAPAHTAGEATRAARGAVAGTSDVEGGKPGAEERLKTGDGECKHGRGHFAVLNSECWIVVPCAVEIDPAAANDEVETCDGDGDDPRYCVSWRKLDKRGKKKVDIQDTRK